MFSDKAKLVVAAGDSDSGKKTLLEVLDSERGWSERLGAQLQVSEDAEFEVCNLVLLLFDSSSKQAFQRILN